MILHINGKVNDEMLDKFIDAYNQNADEYIIYFNSTGGFYEKGKCIIDLINKNASKTKLIAYFNISSSAFEIFFRAKCEREILNCAIGMYHLGTLEFDYNVNGKLAYHCGVAQRKDMIENTYPETIAFCKQLGFTQSELRKFNKGEDVYFLSSRLQEFLNNTK